MATEVPEHKKNGMSLKDWITLAFSAVALVVSSVTAYFAVIRQLDYVTGVAYPLPMNQVRSDYQEGAYLEIPFAFPLTIMNSGTQPIAIHYMDLYASHWVENRNQRPCEGGAHFRLNVDGLILKEKETTRRNVEINAQLIPWTGFAPGSYQVGNYDSKYRRAKLSLSDQAKSSQSFVSEVCMGVSYSTPKIASGFSTVVLATYFHGKQPDGFDSRTNNKRVPTPFTIVRQTSSIFD